MRGVTSKVSEMLLSVKTEVFFNFLYRFFACVFLRHLQLQNIDICFLILYSRVTLKNYRDISQIYN
jgi:hypothetical protein